MTNPALHSRPFFEITGFTFRWWPILLAAVLMQAILYPAREAARWIYQHNPDLFHGQVWAFVGLAMVFQTLAGLICIVAMRRLLPQADTYLRWPPGRSYVWLALLIGAIMAVVMLLADYWPQLISRTPIGGYDLSPIGVPGWLVVMASSGLCEETIFRGLLVGMLTVLVPGRIRAGRFDIPVSGVIMALLFGAAHYTTFLVDPLHLAIAQQLYAFAFGLIYVWLMERSRSLLAPMVAHGVSDFLEVAAVMTLTAAWS